MIRLLEISNLTLFWYYLATSLAYLAMLIIALKTSALYQRRLESHRLKHFPYRQLHMIWRLQGLWQYFRGDHEWKPLKRKGLAAARVQ
jgi:hypothetical protein